MVNVGVESEELSMGPLVKRPAHIGVWDKGRSGNRVMMGAVIEGVGDKDSAAVVRNAATAKPASRFGAVVVIKSTFAGSDPIRQATVPSRPKLERIRNLCCSCSRKGIEQVQQGSEGCGRV